MCSVVQYPSTAACSRGCSPLVGAGQWPWPPMTSGAPVLQYPVRSWLSSTCHVSCDTCDVLQSRDVEMWREAIKLCSSSPQHSYLLTIENMRCWETAVGETLRQWDWAEQRWDERSFIWEPEYVAPWPVCDVSSLWRGDGTWRQRDGLMIRYKEIFLTRKCGHQFYFCFLPLDKCRELLFWSRSNWIIGAQQHSSVADGAHQLWHQRTVQRFHTTHQDLFGQASQFKSEKQCLNAFVLFTVVP